MACPAARGSSAAGNAPAGQPPLQPSSVAHAEEDVRGADAGMLRRSVVKIFARSAAPNFTSPWQMRPQRSSTGSGLCVGLAAGGARYVLTNSHVVSDAVSVRVRRHGDAVRFPARVLCASPQCDLALLEVPDAAFWRGVEGIEVTAEVPSLDSDVLTVGYPMGGDNMSVTRGVVSRVDLMDYTFSPVGGERLPVVQVDAAINPGNSGGPVLNAAGRAIGVAFAGLKTGENIGYVIPGMVVLFFLRNFQEAGGFRGLCSLGLRVQPLQSSPLRSFHRAPDGSGDGNGTGVLVSDVAPMSAGASAGIRAGDVLTAVDGVPIAEDASVPFGASGERIGFDFLVTSKMVGETIRLGVLRVDLAVAGADAGDAAPVRVPVTLEVPTAPLEKLVPRTWGVDAEPSYLVIGGLVFVRLTMPWLLERFGHVRDAPPDLQQRCVEHKKRKDQEVLVLAKVLAAEVNYGYEDLAFLELIEFGAFTGPGTGGGDSFSALDEDDAESTQEPALRLDARVAVRSLRHLRNLVMAAAGPQPAGGELRPSFLRFRMAGGLEVVLDAAECRASQPQILRLNAIPADCSDDLVTLAPGAAEVVPTSRL